MMPSISLSMSYLKYRCEITNLDYPYLPTKGSYVGRTRLALARLRGVARIAHPREICKGICLPHRSVLRIPTAVFESVTAKNDLLQESPSGRIFRFAVGQSGPTPNPSTLEGSFCRRHAPLSGDSLGTPKSPYGIDARSVWKRTLKDRIRLGRDGSARIVGSRQKRSAKHRSDRCQACRAPLREPRFGILVPRDATL